MNIADLYRLLTISLSVVTVAVLVGSVVGGSSAGHIDNNSGDSSVSGGGGGDQHQSNTNSTGEWPTNGETEEDLEKRARILGWSTWSEWSTCSRSCDGGVTFQLRRCHSPQGCRGEPVRHKICNMQPCPEAQDFRAHQCAAYDTVPYDGALFKWTPHYDYSEPCALTCRGHPTHLPEEESDDAEFATPEDEASVIVQLSTRVQDGTRCRSGSLDMCIQGKCQRVGCDLKIGSTKKVDACGVCGGDGGSCAQPLYHWDTAPMSLCSVTCGGGYKMARPSCRNRVSGVDADESLCSATTRPEPAIMQCNTHLCPAKWIVGDWGACSEPCAGGFRDRAVVCIEESNGVGNRVADDICKGPKPKSQEMCNSQGCPRWTVTEWSGCSVSCGTGLQVRSVECMGPNDKLSTQCDPHTKPDDVQICSTGISCNTDQFESNNKNGHRRVDEDEDEDEDEEDIDDDMDMADGTLNDAPYHALPLVQQPTNADGGQQKYPSGPSYMLDYDWSSCSVSCGEGIRRKPYRCKVFLEFTKTLATLNESFCTGPKPTDEIERCLMEPCSHSFGYDESFPRDTHRQNIASSSSMSASSSSSSSSNHDAVKVAGAVPGKTYSWREHGYTSCSASCLGGVEELIINCVRDDTGKVVSPFLCSPETKPEARIRTCNDRPCPPRWNYSEYTPCSKSCGIGIKTREVQCIHEVTRGGENTMVVPNNMCPQPPPPDRQYCNVLDCPVRWEVSEWSKCSKQCGGGVKDRRVECKQIMAQEHKVERPVNMCPSAKPPDKKPCNAKPCAPEDQRPPIAVSNTTYIQHDPKRNKVTLKIGGAATVFFGTQIKIKCPVKRFNRTKIRWSKDHHFLTKGKKFKISKKGALRIIDMMYRDAGVYTCHAGLSTADLRLSVKHKPGELNADAARDHSKPDLQQSTFLIHQDEMNSSKSRDQFGQSGRSGGGNGKNRNKTKSGGSGQKNNKYGNIQNTDTSSIAGDEEPFRSRSQMTVADITANSAATSSGSQTVSMPYFRHLLASLQFFWPFQAFTHSRGNLYELDAHERRPLADTGHFYAHEMAEQDEPAHAKLLAAVSHNNDDHHDDHDDDEDGINTADMFSSTADDVIVLGKGTAENVQFEWSLTPWSNCSQTCGTDVGYKLRKAHCMVRVHNTTQSVDNALCEDAGILVPDTVEQCGLGECAEWMTTDWSPCLQSRCIKQNTAVQRRVIACKFHNQTVSDRCPTKRPYAKQECYNERCRGVWRVEAWSECNAQCGSQGIKYRILVCVWYGTKKPAGDACEDQPRPAVVKVCKKPPCIKNASCVDMSKYCKNARSMGLCRLHRYQQQCCESCKFNIYN